MTSTIGDFLLKFIKPVPSPVFSKVSKFRSLPASSFSRIGKETGLRVTGALQFSYDYRGYCMGSSLTMIACFLRSPKKLDVDRLLDDYQASMANVVMIQNLQEQLAGTHGHSSKKIVRLFDDFLTKGTTDFPVTLTYDVEILYKAFIKYLQEPVTMSLRKHLVEYLENDDVILTKDLYTLILEIAGTYEKKQAPHAHRFHRLQSDILQELGGLCGITVSEVLATYGTEMTVVEFLKGVPPGLYYISFSRHSFAYIKEENTICWLWNSGMGFRQIDETEKGKKILAKSLHGCYTTKSNWISISECF